jgi:hypothetical protein
VTGYDVNPNYLRSHSRQLAHDSQLQRGLLFGTFSPLWLELKLFIEMVDFAGFPWYRNVWERNSRYRRAEQVVNVRK